MDWFDLEIGAEETRKFLNKSARTLSLEESRIAAKIICRYREAVRDMQEVRGY